MYMSALRPVSKLRKMFFGSLQSLNQDFLIAYACPYIFILYLVVLMKETTTKLYFIFVFLAFLLLLMLLSMAYRAI